MASYNGSGVWGSSSSPPPSYRSQTRDETQPLLNVHKRSRSAFASLCIGFLVLVIAGLVCGIIVLSRRLSHLPPSEAELRALRTQHESIKRALDADIAARARLQDFDKWMEDRLGHAREREWWLIAREQYRADKEDWDQQKSAYENNATAWQKALQEHKAMQQRWADEQRGWERERKDFQRERDNWDSERKAREDLFRYETGGTLGVFWEHVESHHCVGHGIREYSATVGFDADSACQHMPITVNGAMFAAPQECRREGDSVVSRWNVDVGEASCKVYWGTLSDMGCNGRERRRFKARLLGLNYGMNPLNMCRSTPIHIRGQHFDQPGECEHTGWTADTSGMWDVFDSTCQ